MKPLYYILIVLLLFSCKAKETTIERTKQSDTLITKSFNYKSKPITTNYDIELECDSLGNIRQVDFNETSGQNKASISIKENKLLASLKTGLSETKVDTIYKTEFKDVYRDKEIIRYKTHPYHWIAHLLAILIIIIILKVKSKIPFI